MASSSRDVQSTNIEQALYNALMKEDWLQVVTIFEGHPEIHATKISNMVHRKEKLDIKDDQYESDTTLHWAIIHKADEFRVVRLVSAIKSEHSSDNMALEILKSRNKRGDTPLHCAASRDATLICKAIIENDESLLGSLADLPYKSLIGEHNKEGETPLFLAAHNGQESTFTYLHSICKGNDSDELLPPSIWRRNNGDTILHCTIRRNHYVFDRELKKNHMLSDLIMDELVKQDPWYNTKDHAMEMHKIENDKYYPEKDMELQGDRIKKSTALLIAAKNGLVEQVKKILDDIPVSIHDQLLTEKRNIVHVAIKERQSLVLEKVKELKPKHWLILREKMDAGGNNALHLAAMQSKYTASGIRGLVMQMQWEIMWFEYVKQCMPPYFIAQKNENDETPGEIFAKEHMNLLNDCDNTVKDMCGSYMVASTLVTGSAFSACFQDIHKYGHTFSISVLISFLFSITSLATFLAIYLSRKEKPKGFHRSLPLKLCLGTVSFLASLISMLVSFYTAISYDFLPKEKYKPLNILYGVILSPVALLYMFTQLPPYWNLFIVSFKKVPRPRVVEEENISRFFQDLRMAQ